MGYVVCIACWFMEEKNQNHNEQVKTIDSIQDGVTRPIKPVVYTDKEQQWRSFLITQMSKARDDREAPHPEFDGMTYSQYYDTNKRADLSYIPPKKNKMDTRIVTGYTREKDNTLLSALLSFNFQADITAYDDEEMLFPILGNQMEDIVKKTRELEEYDSKRPLIYRELISQGDVFVEEIWECKYLPDTENTNKWKPGLPIKDAKFENKLRPIKIERCAVKKHEGKNVYLGNFFEEDYSKQDIIATYELLPRSLAESVYGNWDRWEAVPYEVDETSVTFDQGMTYSNWNMTRVNKDFVGVLKIQLPQQNRYMIMLNGVMMLPIDFPLTEVSPFGGSTITQQGLERITGCAYSKGQPAKTKVDQEVHDEFLRLMVLGMQQSRTPSMAYRGKKVLDERIYTPGKILNNMRAGDLSPVFQNELKTADFSMYELIKQNIDDKTINATFSGQEQTGNKTATQILQEKQAQLLKLGLNFDAVKNLEKRLVWARIGNVIKNYPKPVDTNPDPVANTIDNVYRQFSLKSTNQEGKESINMYRFTDQEFPNVRDVQKEQTELGEYYGKPVSINYFNVVELPKLLKYRWIVNIVPTQDNSDEVATELFVGRIQQAQGIFGPESLNYEYLKERYAVKIKEDPTKFFTEDGGAGIMNMLANSSPQVGVANDKGNAKANASGMAKAPEIRPVK